MWFVTLGKLGVPSLIDNPGVLRAFSPTWGLAFLIEHRTIAFVARR